MKEAITNLCSALKEKSAEELHGLMLTTEHDEYSEFIKSYLEYYHFEEFVKLEQVRFEEAEANALIDMRHEQGTD